jgi:hypothetical protein
MQVLAGLGTLCPSMESIFLDTPPEGWAKLLTNTPLQFNKLKANKVLECSWGTQHRSGITREQEILELKPFPLSCQG